MQRMLHRKMLQKHILAVMLLMYCCLCAEAQSNAVVKSFTQTTDHIPSNDRRNDLNGDPCALVKIQVVDEIERVEGNRIGNIINKGVEKWVYMCKGSRNIRIHLKNHLPVRIMFQDYNINGLESNRVYEAILEIQNDTKHQTVTQKPAASQEDLKTTQTFVLNYMPIDAKVLVDSKEYKGNGVLEIELPLGEHRYVVSAKEHITAEATFTLNKYAPTIITEILKRAGQGKEDKDNETSLQRTQNQQETLYGQTDRQQPATTQQKPKAKKQKDSLSKKLNKSIGKLLKTNYDIIVYRDGRMKQVKIIQSDNQKTLVSEHGAESAAEFYIQNSQIFMLKYNERGNIVLDRKGVKTQTTTEALYIPKGASSIIFVDGTECIAYDVRVGSGSVTYNTEKKGKGIQKTVSSSEVFIISYPDDTRDILTNIVEKDRRERAAEEARIKAESEAREAEIARTLAIRDSLRAEAEKPTLKNPKYATIVTKNGARMKVWVCGDTPSVISYKKTKSAKAQVIRINRKNIKSIKY